MQFAIASCIDKKNKYPEQPFGVDEEPESPDVAAAKFAAFAANFNKQFEKGGQK